MEHRPRRQRSGVLNIGSGNAPDGDPAGSGTVTITERKGQCLRRHHNRRRLQPGGASGSLVLNGGVLDLTGGTAAATGINGKILVGAGGSFTATTGTLQNVPRSSAVPHMVSGTTASGTPTLTKTDGGLLVLAGTNTYTGGTEVSGGTLDFAGPAATPSEGILTVDPGGYVVLGALVGASSPAIDADATEPRRTPAGPLRRPRRPARRRCWRRSC